MQVDDMNIQGASGSASMHLDPERLAAFDHDAPTTDELAHLASCAACRAERQAYVTLQAMAIAMPRAPQSSRLTDWDKLAVGLRSDGLLTTPAGPISSEQPLVVRTLDGSNAPVTRPAAVAPARRAQPAWLQIAAAMVLTIGGALVGRLSSGVALMPSASVATASSTPGATLASNSDEEFASVEQASEVLYRAQGDYERASLWLAANDTTEHTSDVYRARLAALDQMMAASRAALRDAPQDPVLNRYFLSAYNAREATLQALGGALPVDKTLERY
jgi:hypothetical protein